MHYVLDCSVAVKWFIPEELSDVALVLLARLEIGAVSLVAPDSIFAELGHALRKAVLGGELTAVRSHELIQDFAALPVLTVPVRPLAPEAMRLTTAHMTTFYDSVYLALAQREDLLVLTADERMTRAFAPLKRTISLASFS